MLQAVIFDCDGVLVDSETLGTQVLVDAVRDLGLSLTIEQAQVAFKGRPMSTCVALIEQWLGRYALPHDKLSLQAAGAHVFGDMLMLPQLLQCWKGGG